MYNTVNLFGIQYLNVLGQVCDQPIIGQKFLRYNLEYSIGRNDYYHTCHTKYESRQNNNNKNDKKLITLYKILSPEHILKKPFANDNNTLDKNFYKELFYILGLDEIKKGSKRLIQRQAKNKRSKKGKYL